MRIITLNEQDFDTFASNHNQKNIYQTSSYAKFMKTNGYNYHYLGFVNNQNQIIGATLLLYKNAYLNYKIAYAPRGFLLDYTNYDNVKDITEKLKKLLYRQKFFCFTIDPLIITSFHNKNGQITKFNENSNNILNIMKEIKYKHKGFNKAFENKKSRFNAIAYLNKTEEELYKNLNKQTRNKINKAIKSGVTIYKSDNNGLNIIYEFIKRKTKKPIEYYKNLIESYGNNIEIYLAKIEPVKFVEYAKNGYEHELEKNEKINNLMQDKSIKGKDIRKIINKKMESDKLLTNEQANLYRASNILQNKKDGIIIGGCIIIKHKDVRYLYIEGFNKKYKEFNPNYLLKWELIKKFNKEKVKEFNLNAIVGEFNKNNKFSGLNEMKLGFTKEAVEYIGEFDFIINNFIYKLYKKKQKKS